jgi:hypothetical protein
MRKPIVLRRRVSQVAQPRVQRDQLVLLERPQHQQLRHRAPPLAQLRALGLLQPARDAAGTAAPGLRKLPPTASPDVERSFGHAHGALDAPPPDRADRARGSARCLKRALPWP